MNRSIRAWSLYLQYPTCKITGSKITGVWVKH